MAAFNYKITIRLLLSATLVAANVSAQVALDNSFGNGGTVITPSPNNSEIKAATIQSNGNIVVAGYASSLGDNDFQIARYNSNGTWIIVLVSLEVRPGILDQVPIIQTA
jgi:hypothetical protein